MGENRQPCSAEEFRVSYEDSPLSMSWSFPRFSSPLLKCGLHRVSSSQRGRDGKGLTFHGGVTFPWRSLTGATSARYQRGTSAVINHGDSMCPWNDVRRMTLYFPYLPPQKQPQSNQEKNLRQTPVEVHSTNSLTRTLQNCRGHHKRGKSNNPPQPNRRHKAAYNVFWVRSWNRKKKKTWG